MSHDQPTLGVSATWHILRVQVGALQEVPFEDGTWTTAIYKTALDGSIMVTHTGIMGDEHTGNCPDPERAICCCPAEHYTHWRTALELELPIGIFGENLTLAGVNEGDMYIGDTLRWSSGRTQMFWLPPSCLPFARQRIIRQHAN